MWRLATILSCFTACYEPSYRNCAVTCAADTDCAPGHACTSSGVCAGPDDDCQEPSVDAAIDAVPSSPVGRFAMQLVNRENGCAFGNWTESATSNVDVVISQNQGVIVGEPQGLVASFLDAWLGAHVFAGNQDNARIILVLAGNKIMKQGACSYTFDASFDATIEGDVLRGDLHFVARTNAVADCGALTGCASRQALTAVRAPQ